MKSGINKDINSS